MCRVLFVVTFKAGFYYMESFATCLPVDIGLLIGVKSPAGGQRVLLDCDGVVNCRWMRSGFTFVHV